MRKQHTLLSKSGKLLLALGMMFSLVAPYSVHANEPVTPSDGEVTPSNGEVTPSDGEQKDTAAKTENGEYDVMPMAYDTDAPVIDKVELSCNGQKVKPGDEIKVLITAHDENTIKSIDVSLNYKNSKNQSLHTSSSKFTKTANENEYEVTFKVEDGFEEAYLSNIKVTDSYKNFTNANTYENNSNKQLYSFTIENTMIRSYVVKSITFDQNNKTLARNDKLKLTVELEDGYPESTDRLSGRFRINKENEYNDISISMYEDKNKPNTFIGETTIGKNEKSGEYILEEIEAVETGSYTYFDVTANNLDAYKFTLTGEDDLEKPQITSIEMTNQGKVLKPGDSVQIKIKATDNVAIDTSYGYVHFAPTMNVENGSQYIQLVYDETEKAFIGTFKITDETYPCEWYLSSVGINDTFGNYTSLYDYLPGHYNSNNPYYVLVNNDGTFVNKTYDVQINFQGFDEKGNYGNIGEFKKDKVLRRTTYKELGVTFPNADHGIEGLKFTGWYDSEGVKYDENTQVMSNYLTLYAGYDKSVVSVNYNYPSTDGTVKYAQTNLLLENGSTYQDAVDQAKKQAPTDLSTEAVFDGWTLQENDYINNQLDKELSPKSYINLYANYKDKIVINKSLNYHNKTGRSEYVTKVLFVDPNTTYETLKKEASNEPAPELYEGLRFSAWEIYTNEGTVKNYGYLSLNATYENRIVIFAISDEYREYDKTKATRAAGGAGGEYWITEDADIYPVLAEIGETIKVPEIAEYKNIKWLDPKPEGENLVIEWNRVFVGYGDKVDGSNKPDETPDKTPNEKPDDSNKGDNNTPSDNVTVPSKKLPNEKIMGIINEVLNTEEGATIEVDMEGATFVPVQLLQVIKGKDINIKLDMGGYNWTINGKDILTSNLQDIDLEVTLNSNAIPNGIVSELAGDNPVQQLSLTHNGDFGFKASLGFNIGSEHSGKFGNLFYYDSEGKMKFMNAGKIGEDGNVSLDFTHASEYAVVINDKIMSPEKNTVLKGAIKDTSANPADTFNMLWVMSLTGLGMYYYFKKKETEEQA